jgi:hypothetical protein
VNRFFTAIKIIQAKARFIYLAAARNIKRDNKSRPHLLTSDSLGVNHLIVTIGRHPLSGRSASRPDPNW